MTTPRTIYVAIVTDDLDVQATAHLDTTTHPEATPDTASAAALAQWITNQAEENDTTTKAFLARYNDTLAPARLTLALRGHNDTAEAVHTWADAVRLLDREGLRVFVTTIQV